jgi:hypothetical protein
MWRRQFLSVSEAVSILSRDYRADILVADQEGTQRHVNLNCAHSGVGG